MNVLIQHLRNRIEEKKKELEDADRKLHEVQTWRETVARDLEGYERAVAAESRRNGHEPTVEAKSTNQDSIGAPDPQGNKTDFVRFLLSSRSDLGITPSQIYLHFQKENVKMHRNYVYSMLKRLAENDEVEVRNGKYFPKVKGSEEVAALS